MKKEILEKVETLNEYQLKVTDEFLTNLTKKTELPEIFKEELDKLKSTPMDEPKVDAKRNELFENGESVLDYYLGLVEAIYSIDELDVLFREKDIDEKSLLAFGIEIDRKVFGFLETIDGVNVLKEIPSQMELKPLDYSVRKSIKILLNQSEKINGDIEKEKNTDKLIELYKKRDVLAIELEELIHKSHNLDTSKMTKWEKELLEVKIISHSKANYTPPLGKK